MVVFIAYGQSIFVLSIGNRSNDFKNVKPSKNKYHENFNSYYRISSNFFYTSSVNAQSTNSVTVSVENEDGLPTLNWNTSREVNTSYFITEKSTDGINYTAIATTKAASSSMFPRTYQTEDFSNNNSLVYYRVVLVMMNGEHVISNPVTYLFNDITNISKDIAQK